MNAHPKTRLLLTLGFGVLAVVGRAANERYTIDATKSSVSIAVGKTGAFSFAAGHTHEVVGPIRGFVEVDRDDPSHSQVRITIPASELKVTGKGEPPGDVPKVQEAMESDKVLAIARYPQLLFESASITARDRRGETFELAVTGQLTVRDVTRPITIPVHAEVSPDSVPATGRFSIKQTDYGIKPISVAGLVTVKDALDIRFTIAARR
jgi:polyisoprenoid-binding protein YceI